MTAPPTADAFFLPLGDDRYAATAHTSGPWDARSTHAGPPSALLARAVERTPSPWPAAIITRATIDLLGPVPVAELSLRSEVLRSGRSVELVRAELASEGRVAARMTAWRVRRTALDLPALPDTPDEANQPPTFPDRETPLPPEWIGGYIRAMEWRVAEGSWSDPGPAQVWGRMRYPLVPDEEPTGLQRLLTVADSGNGVSNVLPLTWFFINTDLTVHLAAEPVGEWICLAARTRVNADGFGLAESRLYDRRRLVGRGAQALFIGPR